MQIRYTMAEGETNHADAVVRRSVAQALPELTTDLVTIRHLSAEQSSEMSIEDTSTEDAPRTYVVTVQADLTEQQTTAFLRTLRNEAIVEEAEIVAPKKT